MLGAHEKKTAQRRSFSVLRIPDQNSYAADRRMLRAFWMLSLMG